jgi:hypothetical protein
MCIFYFYFYFIFKILFKIIFFGSLSEISYSVYKYVFACPKFVFGDQIAPCFFVVSHCDKNQQFFLSKIFPITHTTLF